MVAELCVRFKLLQSFAGAIAGCSKLVLQVCSVFVLKKFHVSLPAFISSFLLPSKIRVTPVFPAPGYE
jgi:hypothetical protein